MENSKITTPNGSFTVLQVLNQKPKSNTKIELIQLLEENQVAISKCFIISKAEIYSKARNEEYLISSITHPRAIKYIKTLEYIDPDTHINNFAIVIECSDHGNLEGLLSNMKKSKKKFTTQELIQNFSGLVDLLAMLQNKNISHRDIKPDNIFVMKNKFLKLADFGEGNDLKYTLATTIRGTPQYLSPKLYTALKKLMRENISPQVDHNAFKSDVYSLGLVFFRMVTVDSLEEPSTARPEKILKCISNIPNLYIRLILNQMLAVNEEDRQDFIGMNELINAILACKICPVCQGLIKEAECICARCCYGYHSKCVSNGHCVTCKESLLCTFCGKMFNVILSGCSHKACEECHCKLLCEGYVELVNFDEVTAKPPLDICVICFNILSVTGMGVFCMGCGLKMCKNCSLPSHDPVSCILAIFSESIRCFCGKIVMICCERLFFDCAVCGSMCRYCFKACTQNSHLSCSKAFFS